MSARESQRQTIEKKMKKVESRRRIPCGPGREEGVVMGAVEAELTIESELIVETADADAVEFG